MVSRDSWGSRLFVAKGNQALHAPTSIVIKRLLEVGILFPSPETGKKTPIPYTSEFT